MKRPNWQIDFRNLPTIPNSKRWIKGENETLEQRISKKLVLNQDVNSAERKVMQELIMFYGILYKSLQELDFQTFTQKDFKNFTNYIFYAFNYVPLLANKLTIYQIYRVVINENIIGSKKPLNKKRFLAYPPLHVVKKINKYNRANSMKNTVFYGAETIDTALNEIKPKIGDVVSIGVWQPNVDREFNSYPISHSQRTFGINEKTTNATKALSEYWKNHDCLLNDFMEPYFHVLGHEYSKPIKHHYEYLISSMFSDRIFDNEKRENTSFDFECIIYASVGNKFKTSNIAIRKDILRHNFDLTKVIEFEVTECDYDKIQTNNPEDITLVKYRNLKETTEIIENDIIWK